MSICVYTSSQQGCLIIIILVDTFMHTYWTRMTQSTNQQLSLVTVATGNHRHLRQQEMERWGGWVWCRINSEIHGTGHLNQVNYHKNKLFEICSPDLWVTKNILYECITKHWTKGFYTLRDSGYTCIPCLSSMIYERLPWGVSM